MFDPLNALGQVYALRGSHRYSDKFRSISPFILLVLSGGNKY